MDDLDRLNSNNEQIIPWGHELVGIHTDNGKKKVKIAILDSGINNEHEDLEGKIVKEYNALNPTMPAHDEFGHGTAVAGIISANHNNVGIAGVNQNVEIYNVKVLNEKGKGNVGQLVKGIEWAIEQDVDILNVSFGVQSNSSELESVVEKALFEGIIITAAAGNTYGLGVDYPAKYNGVLSISAIKENLDRLSSSAKGKIDFVAPGKDILSTDKNGSYSLFTGTSFSTAFATGLIATVMSQNGNDVDPEEINNILTKQSMDLGARKEYGNGLLVSDRSDVQ